MRKGYYGDSVRTFFEVLFVSFLFLGWYLMSYYGAFYVCFADDVEFHYGKKRMKNRRKKQKSFWQKFLFLDIKKEVIPWHYAMFWINLISSIVALIMLNMFIICSNEIVKIIFIVAGAASFLSSSIIAFVRWSLYAGNKVRSRKKYRKK